MFCVLGLLLYLGYREHCGEQLPPSPPQPEDGEQSGELVSRSRKVN